MMRAKMMLAGFVTFLLASPLAQAREIHVIVNKAVSVQQVKQADIRMIYMAKRSTLQGGEEIIPLDIQEENPMYEDFYRGVLKKTGQQMNSYWSRVLFTGKGRPPQQVSDTNKLVDMVANNRKYMAYVEGDVDDERVKIVYSEKLD